MRNVAKIIAFVVIGFVALSVAAQTRHFPRPRPVMIDGAIITADGDTVRQQYMLDSINSRAKQPPLVMDTTVKPARPDRMSDGTELDTIKNRLYADSLLADSSTVILAENIETVPVTRFTFGSCIANECTGDSINAIRMGGGDAKYNNWLNREASLSGGYSPMVASPKTFDQNKIKYNIDTRAKIEYKSDKADPHKSKLTIKEQGLGDIHDLYDAKIKRRNWLHSFDGALQFSQAYISPNWYQGGNNNLNMLLNTEFNVKLNEAFHPNLLFETSVKYKLAMNSAPEDTLRSYSISDDLFQINSKFGVRAAKRWFYSIQTQFKTQLFNGYKTNTNDLKASFLSPGELNVGLGMTYNYANEKKTFTFDASVSPLSYNLKICANERVDETAFDIIEGHKTASQIGSSGEAKLKWCIAHNITLSTRLFLFSDYSYFQGDLENTLSFAINRFLSTQINVNLRYDTSTPRVDGSKWHKLQMKEILSFGFAYNFKNL